VATLLNLCHTVSFVKGTYRSRELIGETEQSTLSTLQESNQLNPLTTTVITASWKVRGHWICGNNQ